MKYNNSLHIFRRDLRLQDNTALFAACTDSQIVHVAFFIDPRQIKKHKYQSLPALEFMVNSLHELEKEIVKYNGTLNIFYNTAHKALEEVITKNNIDAVYINNDYTPFSKKRDEQLKTVCVKNNIDLHTYEDALLTSPGEILTNEGTPYKVYTSFRNKAATKSVQKPQYKKVFPFSKKKLNGSQKKPYTHFPNVQNKKLLLNGGRIEARALIRKISNLHHYDEDRNFPIKDATTHLSAHNKFGTISIREVYHQITERLSSQHTLINELYWRDFFCHIAYFYPHVFHEAFNKKYNDLKWNTSKSDFHAWCEGQTGFPIVDAGMRQLNTTGYMHNRVRMITGSFLVKNMHIHWQWGEQYFAQKLIDYDPCVNNGNWQWVASTGCDAQPYFRIFNPWLQQKKYDAEALYIKQWIPELNNISEKHIHLWEKYYTHYPKVYLKPILDHKTTSQQAKLRYKSVNN